MKLVVDADNQEQRAEAARLAVGMIFGPNIQNGPLRMAPEFIRRLLQQDWPATGLQIKLKARHLLPADRDKTYQLMLNRMEVYETEFRHVGSAVWLSNDDLRTLSAWEQAELNTRAANEPVGNKIRQPKKHRRERDDG